MLSVKDKNLDCVSELLLKQFSRFKIKTDMRGYL